MFAPRLAGQGREFGTAHRIDQPLARLDDVQAFGQLLVHVDHGRHQLEQHGRLFPVVRQRIELAVPDGFRPAQVRKAQPRHQRGLAVLAGHGQHGLAHHAPPFPVLRVVDLPDDRLLPAAQYERLPHSGAVRRPQGFDEGNHFLRSGHPATLQTSARPVWASASRHASRQLWR